MTLDEKKRPVLVADNFEVNNRYPVGSEINERIRDAVGRWMGEYAKAARIPKAAIASVATNDVRLETFPDIDLPPVKKLGGYLEFSTGGEPYYLEALKAKSCKLVANHEDEKFRATTAK